MKLMVERRRKWVAVRGLDNAYEKFKGKFK
jgi:hypothetical protein